MAYTPHPDNPYPQSSREHWKWFHANDPRAKHPQTQQDVDNMKGDAQRRQEFFGGKGSVRQ